MTARPATATELGTLLEPVLAARPPLLLVSDFDGTLAPLDLDPLGARIDPIARRALRTLARIAERRPGRVELAILSGRTALDVAGRVRVGGLRYLGNHGLEAGALPRRGVAERLDVATDQAFRRHLPLAAALGREVARRLGDPRWLFVESKGPSVAFHFRQADDPDAVREHVLEAVTAAERAVGGEAMVRLEGRRIVELRPLGAGGKGAAIARLVREVRPGAVLVLGDDIADAEAFEVVARERAAGRLVGLNVAVHAHAEVPTAVAAAADVVVPAPRDAARLVRDVARQIEAEEG
ncbi:MAG: trehalose-phosphatase [Chloroflexota bacterium]